MTTSGHDPTADVLVTVEPELADHVADLLGAAGIPSALVPRADGLDNVTVPVDHLDRARATVNLVLPGLLDEDDPGLSPPQATQRLSGRLIRRSDWVADPHREQEHGPVGSGLRDGRQAFAEAMGIEPVGPDEDGFDDGDFIPPPPPPLPRPDVVSRFAWLGAIGGPVLLVLAALFSLPAFLAGLALLAFIIGFAVLVARKPDRAPQDDGWDDGAVV